MGHSGGRCWSLDEQRAAELPGECSPYLYKQLWANVSRHGNMQKVGQVGYLGGKENVCLRATGIGGTATPATSINVAAPMGEAGQFTGGAPRWLGLEHLSHEERSGEMGCSAWRRGSFGGP